jgi:hypothetical protein
VLLQIVADARNIGGDFNAIGQAHASHFPQRRIRLFRSGGVDTGANSTLLRASLQRRTGGLIAWWFSPFSDELVKRRHERSSLDTVKNEQADKLLQITEKLEKLCEGTYYGLAHAPVGD